MFRLLVAASLLAAPALAQDASEAPSADTVLATVGDREITLGHAIAMRARLPEQYQQIGDAQLLDGIVQQIVQQEALAARREAEGVASDALGLENERRAFLAGRAIDAAAAAAVTEEAVRAAYDARVAGFEPATEYSAAHILVEAEEEAQAIVEELDAGADFAELAAERSIGPSGPRGGDLGWFGAGMMVAPFQEAVEALEPGEVSAPVQTQFGWHVIRLNETRETAAPPIEQLRPELEQEVQAEAVRALLEGAEAEADVTRMEVDLDPSVIRRDDLLE